MSAKISIDLARHRLEQAKEEVEASKLLYEAKMYKSANNRAYYSIFHSIKAILSLEPIDFKKHKDVIGYFNKNYIKTEKFPRNLGRKISDAFEVRDDSDYDDEFIVEPNITEEQIETAKELLKLADEYVKEKNKYLKG